MDMRVLVGENVRQTRKLRGLTQEQFAVKSGFFAAVFEQPGKRQAQSVGYHALRDCGGTVGRAGRPSPPLASEIKNQAAASRQALRPGRPASRAGSREPGRKGPSRPFGRRSLTQECMDGGRLAADFVYADPRKIGVGGAPL